MENLQSPLFPNWWSTAFHRHSHWVFLDIHRPVNWILCRHVVFLDVRDSYQRQNNILNKVTGNMASIHSTYIKLCINVHLFSKLQQQNMRTSKILKKKKNRKKIILKHLHLSVSLPVIERRIEFVLYNLLNLMTYN